MSKFKDSKKNAALNGITNIYNNLDYLEKLFWSSGGGKDIMATNRFKMYKKLIERELKDLNDFVESK